MKKTCFGVGLIALLFVAVGCGTPPPPAHEHCNVPHAQPPTVVIHNIQQSGSPMYQSANVGTASRVPNNQCTVLSNPGIRCNCPVHTQEVPPAAYYDNEPRYQSYGQSYNYQYQQRSSSSYYGDGYNGHVMGPQQGSIYSDPSGMHGRRYPYSR